MQRPYVILVTVDGLRTDALASGHYATATSTRMSRYSWYTGLPAYRMPIRGLANATLPVGQGRTLGEVLHRRDAACSTPWRCAATRMSTPGCAATTTW